MNTITEVDLTDNAKNGTITCIKAVKAVGADGYNLYVNLSWKEGDILLITQRAKPREWTSVERMLAHINLKYRLIEKAVTLTERTYLKDQTFSEKSVITITLKGKQRNDEISKSPSS